jgi:hypothetical protein
VEDGVNVGTGMNRLVILLPLHFVTTENKNAIWKAFCGLWTPAQ